MKCCVTTCYLPPPRHIRCPLNKSYTEPIELRLNPFCFSGGGSERCGWLRLPHRVRSAAAASVGDSSCKETVPGRTAPSSGHVEG